MPPRVVSITKHLLTSFIRPLNCVQVYCAPNAPVRRHHVVDGAFSVRGRDLPHGDDTLYIGIAGAADITRNLTKQEMLNPPGTLRINPRGFSCPVHAFSDACIGNLQPRVLTMSPTLPCPFLVF